MFAKIVSSRNPLLKVAAALSALWLAACEPTGHTGSGTGDTSGKGVAVALLLPSGSGTTGDETLATSLRQAAQLAISDLDGVKIDLRIYNTGASPEQAAQVASQAVDEGAKIILGPVYAQAANAAGRAVADRGVNVLAFSNNTDIAGGNVFVLGSTFPNTANRLASYAASQGRGNIFVLSDQTTAGTIGARAIVNAVSQSGASLAGQASYPFSQDGLNATIPQIAGQITSSGANSVFMTADTAGALPLLAQLLPQNGVDPQSTKLIGLTRWDIPNATLALPGLQGGWFALPDPGLNERFKSRYQAAYGSAPHPIAGLAYDGIAAIGALVKAGGNDPLSRRALTQPSGFVGVNGVFRFLPDGTNQRALAVAEVRNGTVAIVDPAPRSFSSAGF